MDEEDFRGMQGTVADFSNWEGVKASGNFRNMNVISKERVIEPVEESEVVKNVKENVRQTEMDLSKATKKAAPKTSKKQMNEIPAKMEIMANPNELKALAIKLLPTVDKISKEEYNSVCERAIELAFTFESVWAKKINLGD